MQEQNACERKKKKNVGWRRRRIDMRVGAVKGVLVKPVPTRMTWQRPT